MAAKRTHRHRAYELLKCYGWRPHVTEYWIQQPGAEFRTRQDMLGFVDLLAFKGASTLAVQVTTPDHVATHVVKMLGIPALRHVLEAGWIVELWGVRDTPTRDGEGLAVRRFVLTAAGELAVRNGQSVVTL